MSAGIHPRMKREAQTIEAMVRLYCRDHHTTDPLCPDCSLLISYARQRLDACRYRERKPTCQKCPIHCYRPGMREKARRVMRYAGPRMLLRHPILAILHLIDGLRSKPHT